MKLTNFYEFEPLNLVKAKMGIPRSVYGDLTVKIDAGRLTELELEKLASADGIEVSVEDITFLSDGTLAYKNSRVILYIRDVTVYKNQEIQPRFHLANCATLKKMREDNRFDRYVVSTNTNGRFKINVIDTGTVKTDTYDLSVCQNCLNSLVFDGFEMKFPRQERLDFVKLFKVDHFFEKYPRSLQPTNPKYNSDNAPLNQYADNFNAISLKVRNDAGWRCQECGVDLSALANRKKLHVHHKNGLKHDNSKENLIALCIDCHAKMPNHGHMKNNLKNFSH